MAHAHTAMFGAFGLLGTPIAMSMPGGSMAFYNTTTFWQWMRLPGDVFFMIGAFLTAWDITKKVRLGKKLGIE